MKLIIRNFLYKNKLILVLLFFLNTTIFVFNLYTPLLSSKLIDSLIYLNFNPYFIVASIGVISVLNTVLGYVLNLTELKLIAKFSFFIQNTIIDALVSSDSIEVSKEDNNFVSQKLLSDSAGISNFVVKNLFSFALNGIMLNVILLLLFKMGRFFFILTIISLLIYILLIGKIQAPMNKKIHKSKDANDYYNASIVECVAMIYSIKKNQLLSTIQRRIETIFKDKYSKSLGEYKIIYMFYSIEGVLTLIIQIIFFIKGIALIRSQDMTVGEFTIILSLYSMIMGTIKYYLSFLKNWQDYKIFCKRMQHYIDLKKDVQSSTKVQSIKSIAINSFSITSLNIKELLFPSSKICPGELILIKGDNGKGKTTFLNSIVGIYEEAVGSIYINSIKIKELDLQDIRKNHMTYVTKNDLFSNMTVKENIEIFLGLELTNQQIIGIASQKQIEFLVDCELLGKKVVGLSEGWKQKTSLLISFFKDTEVLLFDEPLTGLDKISQEKLKEYFRVIKNNYIMFIVDHGTHFDNISSKNIILK